MKIYTRTGDSGETGLFAGPRVTKDDIRIEAIGAVDEFNAHLGLVRAEGLPAEIDAMLAEIQNDLFGVGAALATWDSQGASVRNTADALGRRVAWLEGTIDQFESTLPPLGEFILPGGALPAALLHLARTICRRAERRVVSLSRATPFPPSLLAYLNRLSDFLFVLARRVNQTAGRGDEPWRK